LDAAIVFGMVLRRLRKEAGMTQEQLAFEAGVERNFVSLIERGINQPTIRVIFRLANGLNLVPSKMFIAVEKEMRSQEPKK
jgi:transcriptional regulator with XRE-family HTH domain